MPIDWNTEVWTHGEVHAAMSEVMNRGHELADSMDNCGPTPALIAQFMEAMHEFRFACKMHEQFRIRPIGLN